jgi:subtilisin family serine protease
VRGVPAQLTGRLVAKTTDGGAALAALPEVDRLWPLAGNRGLVVVYPVAGVDEVALSRRLRDRPEVRWAHPDVAWSLVPTTLPDDPYAGSQWHLENDGENGSLADVDIDAETAWVFATGKGQLIAVLDTGTDLDHPDLNVTSGWDYIDRDPDSSPDPEYGGWAHGTACAGVAAALGGNGVGGAGVAYDADVYGIRMIGGPLSDSELYDAFVEATDAGATVLSNSWGPESECGRLSSSGTYEEGIDYVEKEGRGGLGSAFVQAAGNGGCDFSGNDQMLNKAVFAVGAVDSSGRRVGYSSYGELLDIVAPTGLVTADPVGEGGYGPYGDDENYSGNFTGTSAATPVVAGVFALMFEANPRITVKQARRVMRSTAEKIDIAGGDYDAEGFSPYYGYGLVDAGAAVLAVANEAPLAPVVLAPGAEAPIDAVLAVWEPAVDADGDPLTYVVDWWMTAAPELVTTVEVADTRLDLSEGLEVGQALSFTVTAVDRWGPGATSEPVEVMAIEVPVRPDPEVIRTKVEPAGGCSHAPMSGWLALFALAGLRRRR